MYNFKHLTSTTLKRNLRLRSEVLFRIREYFYKNGFLEVSTPILSFPTQEYGDGEYTVFSKLHPSMCYSLPHSPQLYKQYLIAGMGNRNAKYFQLASNFRPEPGDATHAQEFQQLDFEIANAGIETIQEVISDVVRLTFANIGHEVSFIKLNYSDSIRRYGNDSPDLRHGSEIEIDLSGKIYISFKRDDIINAKQFREIVSSYNHFDIIESSHALKLQGTQEKHSLLGEVRNRLISNRILKLVKNWSFVWLIDPPLFVARDDGTLKTYHHPQMAPADDRINNLKKIKYNDLLKLRGAGCDLIINGIEVAGGNVRNNDYQTQKQILRVIGCTKQDLETTYKPLLTLLKRFPSYSSGGAAIGFDRLLMFLTGSNDIRNTQPFPMEPDGRDFMGGPWPVTEREKLYINP